MKAPIVVAPEVADAIAENQPIVALESTIITHGMPAPENLATARSVEADVRDQGAIPATIAVMDGALQIGLDDTRLEMLASAKNARKLSRSDMAVALIDGAIGSTTVAATMIAARLAGIPVFATGGIGGVHRGAETTFDISADLEELARTSVTVVASGAKAILDLPKTLEALETRGVPVIVFGQSQFPAFWSQESGLAAPIRIDSPKKIAEAHLMRQTLGLGGGQLIANPIPSQSEISARVMEPHIQKALQDASSTGVSAKDVTPYLLSRIGESTEGNALRANIALVRNNAKLAGRISVELAKLSN